MQVRPCAILLALPALVVLAGCSSAPERASPAASASTAAPPVQTPGATVTPNMPPATSGSSTMTAAPIRMTPTDIRSTLVNNTATGLSSDGQTYFAWFGPTGQVRFVQGNFRDTGTWRILPDGSLCSQMRQIADNAEQCYSVYRNGNVMSYGRPGGSELGSFSVLPGNPQNL